MKDGISIMIGVFKSEMEAAEAYDLFLVSRNIGDMLNFPEKRSIYEAQILIEFPYPDLPLTDPDWNHIPPNHN